MPDKSCPFLSKLDVLPQGLQCSCEMFLSVWLDGVDRIQAVLGQKLEELIERERPFAQGEMFIPGSVVIVEVGLSQVFSQHFQP